MRGRMDRMNHVERVRYEYKLPIALTSGLRCDLQIPLEELLDDLEALNMKDDEGGAAGGDGDGGDGGGDMDMD
jgi:hypothetical protein